MLIGYARVSTHDQTLNLQQDALKKAECSKIFTDAASGAKTERQGLDKALNYVRSKDTLVVWRLDRLGRSLPHLITTMTGLEERGIGFKSLTENIEPPPAAASSFSISSVLSLSLRETLSGSRQPQASQLPEPEDREAAGRKHSLRDNSVLLRHFIPISNTQSQRFAGPSRSPKPRCTGLSRSRTETSNPHYSSERNGAGKSVLIGNAVGCCWGRRRW
jgi:Resolvase, N terminal domain